MTTSTDYDWKADVGALLDYNWDSERRDYLEQIDGGSDDGAREHHIFTVMMRLHEWLQEHSLEA